MKLSRKTQAPPLPGVHGTTRVDRRLRPLLGRVRAGDVVVIDHTDLDRATAQTLADAEVAAVVNASRFVSGRYPSQGASLLLDAGIALVEDAGPAVLAVVSDGDGVRLHDGVLFADEKELASGRVLDREALDSQLEEARTGMAVQLERLSHESAEMVRREQGVLLHGRGIPQLNTRVADRPVLVAAPGPDLEAELDGLAPWLEEQKPVVLAVDGAAEVLLRRRRKPQAVVVTGNGGDGSDHGRVPPKAVKAAKDVVVVVERGSRPPEALLERLGSRATVWECGVTTEDAGLLVAHAGGASMVVAAGVHASLDDFLDRQRGGLSSTYLTRLRVADKLVDARAVPDLYSGRLKTWHLWLVLLVGLLALAVAVGISPAGRAVTDRIDDPVVDAIHRGYDYVEGLFQ